MTHKCPDCDKVFTSNQSLKYHTTKKVCQKPDGFICEFCGKELSSAPSLSRHRSKTCKERKRMEMNENMMAENAHFAQIYERLLQLENENKRLKELEMENSNLKSQVSLLKNDTKVVNKTTNNNCNINNGTVNNYYLVGYGKEDLSKVDHDDLLKGMRLGFNSTLNLIDSVHFNPKYPEFHNVYISSMKNKYAMMYDGTTWTLVMKDDLIDKLYDDKRNYIEENLEEFVGSLTPSQVNALHRWMNADDTHPYISKIKNDIKLLLYNKRHMPLDNMNKKKNKLMTTENDELMIVNNDMRDIKQKKRDVRVIKQKKHGGEEMTDLESKHLVEERDNKSMRIKSKTRFQRTAPRYGTKRKNAKVRRR